MLIHHIFTPFLHECYFTTSSILYDILWVEDKYAQSDTSLCVYILSTHWVLLHSLFLRLLYYVLFYTIYYFWLLFQYLVYIVYIVTRSWIFHTMLQLIYRRDGHGHSVKKATWVGGKKTLLHKILCQDLKHLPEDDRLARTLRRQDFHQPSRSHESSRPPTLA